MLYGATQQDKSLLLAALHGNSRDRYDVWQRQLINDCMVNLQEQRFVL